MLLALIGESCTGKSTIADALKTRLNCTVYTGKDYLRLAKSEAEAAAAFKELLCRAVSGTHAVYVISETEQLALLPDGALRIVVTAALEQIKTRFAARMHGNLPAPVAAMLEKKHGMFDELPCALRVDTALQSTQEICDAIEGLL